MVSKRMSFQRRRSHSATATSPPRRSIDNAFRVATKRAHPHRSNSSSSLSSDASSALKWDLDCCWRQGKRRRKDIPPTLGTSDMDVDQFSSIVSASKDVVPRPTALLPSSPAAFQLSPKAGRRTMPKPCRFTCHSDSSTLVSERDEDLNDLRSSALWELHRSVAENGEGFVRRMRDYENSRKGKKRASVSSPPPPTRVDHMSDCSDDEDDVQILDGALSPDIHSWSRLTSPHAQHLDCSKTTFSLTTLLGTSQPQPNGDEQNQARCFFSVLPSPTQASSLTNTPALTHVQTDSARSSLISLPLVSSETRPSSPCPPYQSYPTSRTDKAIAALSLALANGAAGLNDYATLQAIQIPLAMDECHVGEMWD